MKRILKIFSLASLAVGLVGCKVEVDLPDSKVNVGGGTTANLACAVSPQIAIAATPGSAFGLTVTAVGGTAPYTIKGGTNSFNSNISFTRTYENVTEALLTLNDSVTIVDAAGKESLCSFSVQVKAVVEEDDEDNTPVQPLSCEATTNKAYSFYGEEFKVTAVAKNAPDSDVRITRIDSVYEDYMDIIGYASSTNKMSVRMAIYNDWSQTSYFPFVVTIKDSQGRTATCNATQIVLPWCYGYYSWCY